MLTLLEDTLATPLGKLWIICDTQYQLRAVEWETYLTQMNQYLDRQYLKEEYEIIHAANPGGLTAHLSDYFAGNLHIIDELPVACAGTPFQREVWHFLRLIPCGYTTSYGEIAKALGRPGASRAVGAANGANPVSIVVPCHRVIGSQSDLTGYSGGISRKEWLLRHEGVLLL